MTPPQRRQPGPAVRVGTLNVDFSLKADKVREDLQKVAKDNTVLFLQETKNVDVKQLLGPEWTVFQQVGPKGKQGTAVAYRKSLSANAAGRSLGVRPGGFKMLNRWITWVEIDGVTYASAHRPPKRFKALDPAFDAAIRRWAKTRKRLVLGMDANTKNYNALSKSTGLKVSAPPAGGIDVFLTRGVKIDNVYRLNRTDAKHDTLNSDHTAVTARIRPY